MSRGKVWPGGAGQAAVEAVALREADYGLRAPFTLIAAGTEPLAARMIYRHVPGRRITFRAGWGNTEVVAKLFYREKEYRRERRGLEILHRAHLPAPRVLCHLVDTEQGVFLLLTEYLYQSRSLAALCREEGEGMVIRALAEAVALIGRSHRAGFLQRDIHLDNFLDSRGHLFLIDGAGIESKEAVSGRDRRDNLALFFAQLLPNFDSLIPRLLPAYGDGVPDEGELCDRVVVERERRIRHVQEKSLRSCSEFAAYRDWHRMTAIRRDGGSDVERLVAAPEVAIGGSRMLKPGNTATVVRVGEHVIKRYNIRDWRHFLGRCWRPSRARVSWCNGLRLALLGIPTPRPLALRENRYGPVWREAYLVSEYVTGPNLQMWAMRQKTLPSWVDVQIRHLFDILWQARVGHGDMKATNFLIDGETLVLLDLDVMTYYSRPGRFLRAHRRDLTRFLDNWQGSKRAHFRSVLAPCLERAGLTADGGPAQ